MTHCPTLVIAGTHSGAGKTSFTLALARALARRGREIQTFKVGPDFLDPTYLALASGRPCYSLDGGEKKRLGNTLAAAIRKAVGKRTEGRLNAAVVLIDLGGCILGEAGDLIPWG